MNETETHYEVKSEIGVRHFLEAKHAELNLPSWASFGAYFVPQAGCLIWSIHGSEPRTRRFVSTPCETIEDAHAAFLADQSGDKLRAEIKKLQAQLAQVEGGAV